MTPQAIPLNTRLISVDALRSHYEAVAQSASQATYAYDALVLSNASLSERETAWEEYLKATARQRALVEMAEALDLQFDMTGTFSL